MAFHGLFYLIGDETKPDDLDDILSGAPSNDFASPFFFPPHFYVSA